MTIDELIDAVNIALDSASLAACPAVDVNRNRAVTIDEVVSAVRSALTGCPPVATPTPPPTPSPAATRLSTRAAASLAACQDPAGGFVVVFEQYELRSIFAQRYDSRGIAGRPEARVSTDTAHRQTAPDIACDSDGGFAVVWQAASDEQITGWDVYTRRFDRNDTPRTDPLRVNTSTFLDQEIPAIVSDAHDHSVVVWQSFHPDGQFVGYDAFAQRFDGNGIPQGIEFRVNATPLRAQRPDVAIDDAGTFVVVWEVPNSNILAARFDASGKPRESEFVVNTTVNGAHVLPAVAADAAGNIVIIWVDHDLISDGSDIVGRRFRTDGTPAGGQFRVNSSATGRQTLPAVASDAAGNLLAVWMSAALDGSSIALLGQRYASDGAPVGGELRVASAAANGLRPAVSWGAQGGFLVVWSNGGSAERAGLFAQRYR